jgi:Xaa-Pro aminopeptidase
MTLGGLSTAVGAEASREPRQRATLALPDIGPDMPLVFDQAEYAARIQRFKGEMARRHLDVMLLYSNKSFFYLYGYDMAAGVSITYKAIIAPLKGAPTAHIRNTLVPWTTRIPQLQDVRTYDVSFDDSNARETVGILADRGLLSGKRIGIETRSLQLNAHEYGIVREEVGKGGGELVDASDLVMELCIRKSPAEIAVMRQAGKLYDVAAGAVLAAVKPGVRECDVNAEAMYAHYAAGGDDTAQPLMIVPAPPAITHMLPPTRRRLNAGEILFFEVAGCINRYHVIGAQAVACGTGPGTDTQEAFKRARESANIVRSLIKPGVATADLAKAALAARGDVRNIEAFHAGYSMGIAYRYRWHEDLIIRTGDSHVLEEGMTLSIFGFGSAGDTFLFTADPIVVTEDGIDNLSALPRDELRVLE